MIDVVDFKLLVRVAGYLVVHPSRDPYAQRTADRVEVILQQGISGVHAD